MSNGNTVKKKIHWIDEHAQFKMQNSYDQYKSKYRAMGLQRSYSFSCSAGVSNWS